MCLGGRADIGFRHDLDQRHAASIEIEICGSPRILKSFMKRLTSVLLHVNALYADFLFRSVYGDLDEAVLRKRTVVLRDLVSLRKIGIEVVLPGPHRFRIHAAVQPEARFNGHRYGSTV